MRCCWFSWLGDSPWWVRVEPHPPPAWLFPWGLFDAWFLPLCLPADTDHGQRLPEVDVAQQLKLRDRQRFFEEVFQHDVDVYLSSAHLCIRDYKRRELERGEFLWLADKP